MAILTRKRNQAACFDKYLLSTVHNQSLQKQKVKTRHPFHDTANVQTMNGGAQLPLFWSQTTHNRHIKRAAPNWSATCSIGGA